MMKNNFESISSPVECYKLKFISVYLFLLFITSAFCNLLLLVIIYKYKRFRNTLNIYMFFLTLFNLIGTFVELPATIATNFACRYQMKFFKNFFSIHFTLDGCSKKLVA